jgi:hypothetical protein
MPSLLRFLAVLCVLGVLVFGGLYALAVLYEPPVHEVTKPVHGVAIRQQ